MATSSHRPLLYLALFGAAVDTWFGRFWLANGAWAEQTPDWLIEVCRSARPIGLLAAVAYGALCIRRTWRERSARSAWALPSMLVGAFAVAAVGLALCPETTTRLDATLSTLTLGLLGSAAWLSFTELTHLGEGRRAQARAALSLGLANGWHVAIAGFALTLFARPLLDATLRYPLQTWTERAAVIGFLGTFALIYARQEPRWSLRLMPAALGSAVVGMLSLVPLLERWATAFAEPLYLALGLAVPVPWAGGIAAGLALAMALAFRPGAEGVNRGRLVLLLCCGALPTNVPQVAWLTLASVLASRDTRP